MTKDEALQILDTIPTISEQVDALEMAIQALSQEPCEVSEYDKDHIWYKGGQYISLRRVLEVKAEAEKEPCDDAISRDAVLDKIRAEIDVARFIDKDTKLCKNANASGLEVAMQIIDKYR